jgi:hypothetical protein
MKVYINKYKDHWISPYTMLDYVFFWTDWSKCSRGWTLTDTLNDESDTLNGGKSRYVERPDWLEPWADRLMPISRAIQWVWDKVDRKIDYVKIDRWDTWSMDHTLGKIALPMLKQLKATKHGSPFVDDEDVPEELKSTSAPPKENDYDTDDNHHKRWDWVMDEMIFAFEHKLDDSWQDAYRSGTHDMQWIPVDKDGNEVPKGEHKYYQMKDGPNNTYKCDYDGIKLVETRIQNGFRLFGKYYQGLWD